MDEVINGLETSIGAQLAAFEKLSKPVQVRNREGTGVDKRRRGQRLLEGVRRHALKAYEPRFGARYARLPCYEQNGCT
jgi:hypothetical protein